MRFTQAYSGSTVCGPSRCVLMTGKHTGHSTVRGNKNPELPVNPDEPTLGTVMKSAGYRTALFGKWGLGGTQSQSLPDQKGFDEFFGYLNHWHAHLAYPEHIWDNRNEVLLFENWFNKQKTYVPDLFMKRTLDFIEKHEREPFFIYLSPTVPHANNEGKTIEVPDQGVYARENWPGVEKNFAACVTRMDEGIGRIMDLLKKKNLDENTLVVFTSDNGPHKEGGHDARLLLQRRAAARNQARSLRRRHPRSHHRALAGQNRPRPHQRFPMGLLGRAAHRGRGGRRSRALRHRRQIRSAHAARQAATRPRLPLLGVLRRRLPAGDSPGRLETGPPVARHGSRAVQSGRGYRRDAKRGQAKSPDRRETARAVPRRPNRIPGVVVIRPEAEFPGKVGAKPWIRR